MADRPAPRPASTPLLLIFYIGVLIGGIVLFYILTYIAEAFLGLAFPENNSMGIIIVVVAAMTTGNYWYSREQARPSSGRKWVVAFLMGIVTILLQAGIVMFFVNLAGEGDQLMREFAGEDVTVIAAVLAGVGLLQVLLLRAALWFGIHSAAKRDERLLGKA